MSRPDPSSSEPASGLDPLFARLRAASLPADVTQVAHSLPARVGARLRAENAEAGGRHGRWAVGLAPFTLALVIWAAFSVNELRLGALADPQTAGWLMFLFG